MTNGNSKYSRFSNIGFDDFRQMASDQSLSCYEKIGFPDEFRKGQEGFIFNDIKRKLSRLKKKGSTVLDIGPGCSELPRFLIKHCEKHKQMLYLVDNQEMLDILPEESKSIQKVAAYYPDCPNLLQKLNAKVDVILCYSVFQYITVESNTWDFIDRSLALLAPGGEMLIGDIPNISKRKRFFSSNSGKEFHKAFMNTDTNPEISFNTIEPKMIDDSMIFAVLMRARNSGFDAYVVPQNSTLPMANRREDILIIRP